MDLLSFKFQVTHCGSSFMVLYKTPIQISQEGLFHAPVSRVTPSVRDHKMPLSELNQDSFLFQPAPPPSTPPQHMCLDWFKKKKKSNKKGKVARCWRWQTWQFHSPLSTARCRSLSRVMYPVSEAQRTRHSRYYRQRCNNDEQICPLRWAETASWHLVNLRAWLAEQSSTSWCKGSGHQLHAPSAWMNDSIQEPNNTVCQNMVCQNGLSLLVHVT